MNETRQKAALAVLSELVALCEMDERFTNPEGGNWPLLNRAKAVLNPQAHLFTHPTEGLYAASLLDTKLSNQALCNLEHFYEYAAQLKFPSHVGGDLIEFDMARWEKCHIGMFIIFGKTELQWAMRAGIQIPAYRGETEYKALALYFDISEDDAKFLFDHDSYESQSVKPETALNRLQRYIQSGGWLNK